MSGDSDANVFLTQGNEAGVDLLAHGAATSAEMVHSGTGVDQGVDGAGGQDHVSQSTRLHHKMREMKEMDDALALMKSDYADRIRAVKEGESKFLVKQHNIIKYLRRFKLFILESDTKRARAEKKESEEHRQRSLKIKEIDALRTQFLLLQQTRSDLKQKNDHYKQNKQYLESVKDAVPEQYGEIDELIVRHQILKQTNTDLTESNRKVNEKMEAIGAELQQLYKTKQNDILVKNSKFASLLQKLEQVTNETSSIENEVVAMEVRTRDMNRYFCEVQMAIQNIYARTMSSLPSAKAATQMKKRMHQQALASKEAAVQAANANGGLLAADDQATAAAYAPVGGPGSRLGTAGVTGSGLTGSSSGGMGSDLDSDDDYDGGSGGGGTGDNGNGGPNGDANNQTPASASSPADEAAMRAAAAAHSRTAALKQQGVKAHLLSRLDAIMERLEDLQDIVDYIHPGALQMLREGGTIFQTPNLHLGLAAYSSGSGGGGGASGAPMATNGNGGPTNGGGGGGQGRSSMNATMLAMSNDMRSGRRATQGGPTSPHRSSAGGGADPDSFRRSKASHSLSSHSQLSSQQHPPRSPSSPTSKRPAGRSSRLDSRGGGGGDDPHQSTPLDFSSTAAKRASRDPQQSSDEYRGEARLELERKFRSINAGLAHQMPGILPANKNAADMPLMAVKREARLPPVKPITPAATSRHTPRSAGSTSRK